MNAIEKQQVKYWLTVVGYVVIWSVIIDKTFRWLFARP